MKKETLSDKINKDIQKWQQERRNNGMVKELKEKDFDTRKDGVLPYAKEIIINHITSIIKELNRGNKQ